MNNDWKKTYLGDIQEKPKKPTIRFLKEELDYVAQQISWHNSSIPGKLEIERLEFIRKAILNSALKLLTNDVNYIETFGFGVRKSDRWDEDPNGIHLAEVYIQPCFIRGETWGEYDGEQIL